MSASHERFKELLLRLQSRPEAERASLLETEVEDVATRNRLRRLLAASDDAEPEFLNPLVELPRSEEPTRVGPYELECMLGRGGMARVYRAVQTHPLERTVALKVAEPGLDSRDVLRRFDAESRVLAHLEHRNIARVLDAGADPYGPAYFVMELVDGPPITEYAEQNEYDVRERLELFLQLCRGVQHAHARGVLHRDLKPTNVLVGTEDGEPVVKIIDFGVAKALGSDSPLSGSRHTTAHQIIGTLEYMSPEQAEFGNPDVDSRADVYALGVVLYEMLTGDVPLTRAAFENKSVRDIQELIRNRVPAASERARRWSHAPRARLRRVEGAREKIPTTAIKP